MLAFRSPNYHNNLPRRNKWIPISISDSNISFRPQTLIYLVLVFRCSEWFLIGVDSKKNLRKISLRYFEVTLLNSNSVSCHLGLQILLSLKRNKREGPIHYTVSFACSLMFFDGLFCHIETKITDFLEFPWQNNVACWPYQFLLAVFLSWMLHLMLNLCKHTL